MDKYALSFFPHLKEGDEVLFAKEGDHNINMCGQRRCISCAEFMQKHYLGYLRKGIFQFEELS